MKNIKGDHLKLLLATFSATIVVTTCQGQVIASEWDNGFNPPLGYTASRAYIWGQAFTTTTGGTLDTISVYADVSYQFSEPPTVIFQFYQVQSDSGVAGDSIVLSQALASETVSAVGLPKGGWPIFGWLPASFAKDGLTLNAGQRYAVSMSYDTSNNQEVDFAASPGYTGGTLLYSSDNGTTFYNHPTAYSMGFIVTVVPEPAIATLLGIGSFAIIWSILNGKRKGVTA